MTRELGTQVSLSQDLKDPAGSETGSAILFRQGNYSPAHCLIQPLAHLTREPKQAHQITLLSVALE